MGQSANEVKDVGEFCGLPAESCKGPLDWCLSQTPHFPPLGATIPPYPVTTTLPFLLLMLSQEFQIKMIWRLQWKELMMDIISTVVADWRKRRQIIHFSTALMFTARRMAGLFISLSGGQILLEQKFFTSACCNRRFVPGKPTIKIRGVEF